MIPFYTASGDNRIPKDYIHISSFSGIILYSDLQGKLTGIRIRENGKMYKGKFIRNAEEENTVAELYYLSLYRSRSLATKGEDDDWELEIDELYVIGRRGEGEDPGRNPDDFDMPEDDEVHDDDSDNGGGGSEGEGGGNGGDYTEPEWTDPAYPNWKFDERSKKMIRPLIDTLAKDCAGKALLNSVKNMDITYKYLSGNYIISFIKNPKGNHSIKWFAYKINSYELLEELVHGLQILNGTHDRSHALNSEIEAKLAVYRYASKYNLVDSLPGTKNEWDKYAGKYLDSVCNENYEKLITFIRSQNYPKESFPEDSAWRHTNNIINLFDCYKPKPGL